MSSVSASVAFARNGSIVVKRSAAFMYGSKPMVDCIISTLNHQARKDIKYHSNSILGSPTFPMLGTVSLD
jgi:hypothetical protein